MLAVVVSEVAENPSKERECRVGRVRRKWSSWWWKLPVRMREWRDG